VPCKYLCNACGFFYELANMWCVAMVKDLRSWLIFFSAIGFIRYGIYCIFMFLLYLYSPLRIVSLFNFYYISFGSGTYIEPNKNF
jgi:hypothetical protein